MRRLLLALPALLVIGACSNSDSTGGFNQTLSCPSARLVTSNSDLVPGPLARGALNDFVLENSRIRSIVQKAGRNWFSIAQFGGNIIDAVPKDAAGRLSGEDHYEEAVLGTNIESAPNYQQVEIVQAGGRDENGDCQTAIIRASGPDDLMDFVNGSSAIRDLGFSFPDSADDIDLPVQVVTDYSLAPGSRAIRVDTRLINESSSALDIYMVEYLNGSGEVELFQHGYGFGEPLITAPCDECRYAIYAGHEGGTGVSYGWLHDEATTTSLTVSGVSILLYGNDALLIAAAGDQLSPPAYTVPADGEFLLTRHFAVGTGDVASVLDIHYELRGDEVGLISGQVRDDRGPVAGAEIAVISSSNNFDPVLLPDVGPVPVGSILVPRGPETLVVNHMRTDHRGRYQGSLPPGSYELRINAPGRGTPEPATVNVDIAADTPVEQDFHVPLAANLRVLVSDENGQPVAAKVQLIGEDSSPDAGEPLNGETIFQGPLAPLLSNVANLSVDTGIFGDAGADPLPNGMVLTEFAVRGQRSDGAVTVGDTGVLAVEPGEYVLSVSRGNRYSEHRQTVSLQAGQLSTVEAVIARVVDTPGQAFGDFHVHSFNSPDSEVTDRERVATYLSEDVDFFTPSDHGMRRDFSPAIASMRVGNLIATAPSSENTTFDYGHINAWPVFIDTSPASTEESSQSNDAKTSAGSVDWGNAAAPGLDFPSKLNYGLTPAQIFADAKSEPFTPGREVVVQINHIETHFGAAGLQIDTGISPPQSARAPSERRLNPSLDNLYDASHGYDSMELWIGADGLEQLEHFPNDNLGDWFNLLNQGVEKTFVANSDTHTRRVTSLSTRNMIPIPPALEINGRPDMAGLSSNPHALADYVRAGRSVGTNSLWLDAAIVNKTTPLDPNDPDATSPSAGLTLDHPFGTRAAPLAYNASDELELQIKIRSPLWAEYDHIAVYLNSDTQQRDEDGVIRYRPCSRQLTFDLANEDFSRRRVAAAQSAGQTFHRYETDLNITLNAPAEDFWLVVYAEGTPGVSKPLWPVVADDFTNNDDDPLTASAEDRGMPAIAMTNPLFFDFNGDGYTAPGLRFCEPEESGGPGGLPIGLPVSAPSTSGNSASNSNANNQGGNIASVLGNLLGK